MQPAGGLITQAKYNNAIVNNSPPSRLRLLIVGVVAAAILFAIVVATGSQTLSSPSNVPAATLQPTSASATAVPAGSVQGTVTSSARHLAGNTWRFRYTVRAQGKTPVGGFQISGPSAHLFHVVSHGWNYYGTGVCHTTGPAGLLIYWSTNAASSSIIHPGQSAVFGFDVNTSGPGDASYSLSYGTATPGFGHLKAPKTSSMAPSVPCK